MKRDTDKALPGRRDFLKLAGAGALAGGAAVAASGQSAEAHEAPAPAGNGYRESEHVRTYYKLARF